MTPKGRARNLFPKCRVATSKAMKHRRDNDTSVREERAARREPRGGEEPMEPSASGRLMRFPCSGVTVDKCGTIIF